jgi:hypothetical protein
MMVQLGKPFLLKGNLINKIRKDFPVDISSPQLTALEPFAPL